MFRSLGHIALLTSIPAAFLVLFMHISGESLFGVVRPTLDSAATTSTQNPPNVDTLRGTTTTQNVPKITTPNKVGESSAAPQAKPPMRAVPSVKVTEIATAPKETPLDVGTPSNVGLLSQEGIWRLTNVERQKAGLPILQFSKRLTDVAEAKALDMRAKQYFAHVSPSGVDIKQLSEIYGYQYLSIGENLALGNFTGNADVVLGWMNSPGHRANILNTKFTEIGISAIVGNYEGEEVWFAVQEFGRPSTDCPKPDALLGQKITIFNTQLEALEVSLRNLEAEIALLQNEYSQRSEKTKDYNTIVTLYNDIATRTKENIGVFNAQVRSYDICVGGI